jgi:hypothetical protein
MHEWRRWNYADYMSAQAASQKETSSRHLLQMFILSSQVCGILEQIVKHVHKEAYNAKT